MKKVLLFLAALVCVGSAAAQYPIARQLMTLDATKTHLINSYTNKPVFIVGDSPQMAPENLTLPQWKQYLLDRQGRGFNAVWMYAVDKSSQPNPPYNYYGYQPFNGADFTNFDANYWAYVDQFVQLAADHGMTVFFQTFFTANAAEQPYEYYSSLRNSSAAQLRGFGSFLGNRYKGYNNIVWVLGGDANPRNANVYSQLNIFGSALAAADSNHLITLEPCQQCVINGYNSVSAFLAVPMTVPSWLTLNWTYATYQQLVLGSNAAYQQSPFLPPLFGEAFYELENNMTVPGERFQMYTSVLSGTYLGYMFGNGAIWGFNSPHASNCVNDSGSCHNLVANPQLAWQLQLASPSSQAMTLFGKLFNSREHWLLVPDISHTVLTGGYGSGTSISTAARTSDGQTIIAYIPNGNAATVTVNMTKITSSMSMVRGWWFNPVTGATTNLGMFANTGTHYFTSPDANDWVLVLDDANANLGAPGQVSKGRNRYHSHELRR